MELYKTGKLDIIKIKRSSESEIEKEKFRKRGSQQNYFHSQEPIQITPNGPRFSINGRRITYLDWKFNFMTQSHNHHQDLLYLMWV